MRSFIVLSALSALLVSAQDTNFTINPSEVDLSTRASWCTAQSNTCGTLCDGSAQTDECSVDTLQYTCTCQNGSAPGLQYYTQTMYTFVCQQAFQDCNLANVGNAKGQENCTTSIQDKCGKLDPADYSAAPSSTGDSGSSPSSTASGTAGSTAASSAGASSSPSAAAAAANIQNLGTGALAAGMGILAYLL